MTTTFDDPGGLDLAEIGSLRVPWTPRRIVLGLAVVVMGGAVVWGWRRVGMNVDGLVSGFGDIRNLLDRMLPPTYKDASHGDDIVTTIGTYTINWRYVWFIVSLAWETLLMALLGTTLAVALSFPVAFMGARNTTPKVRAFTPLYPIARAVITLARAVPDLIFALIFVRAVGIGPLPGILALGLHSVGMIGKLYADAIEQVDEGPREAVRSTGSGWFQEMTSAVIPQTMPSFIAVGLYRLDINLRVSVILGIVGAGGIGFELQAALRSLVYDRAMGIVLVIAVLVIAVELASTMIRQSIIGGESTKVVKGARQTAAIGARMLGKSGESDVALLDDADSRLDVPTPDLDDIEHARLTLPWTRTRKLKAGYVGLLVALIGISFLTIDISPLELVTSVPDILSLTGRLNPFTFAATDAGDLPSWIGWLPLTQDVKDAWGSMFEGMVETIAIGITATAIGIVCMSPFAFLSARNIAPNNVVYYGARMVLVYLRSIPELILAVIFVAAMGLGPIPGVLALSLGTIGFLAKLMADSLEEIPEGPREAVATTGSTRLQEGAASVVPQALPAFVSNALYTLDINIRTSTILGIVGGGGIGFLLFNSLKTLHLDVTGAIIIMIFVVVYAIELVAGWIRKLLL